MVGVELHHVVAGPLEHAAGIRADDAAAKAVGHVRAAGDFDDVRMAAEQVEVRAFKALPSSVNMLPRPSPQSPAVKFHSVTASRRWRQPGVRAIIRDRFSKSASQAARSRV